MKETIIGLVTPHLLRVVDLANQAEKGVNVDWHVRAAVVKTLADLGQQYNGPVLVAAYVDALEAAAAEAPGSRMDYRRALETGAAAARAAPGN